MFRHAKRWLYIVHRWIGIASCLLFAMWFASGLVMIYVPYPALTRAEQLAGLPEIDWSHVHVSADGALRAAGLDRPPATRTLEMRGSQPVWRIVPDNGAEADVSATTGRPLGAAGIAEARATATLFGLRPVETIAPILRDQWTVAGGYDRHRPLWKAEMEGPGGHVLYISSRTGTVVLDTDSHERFWNWLGSVPHWLYPTVLRRDNSAWRQVVMWVSGPCILASVTGFWIGILRTRLGRRRFKAGLATPYRGWMAWHHIAGLIGGIFLTTWIFSGWLSVDPFRLFATGGIDDHARAAYARAGSTPAIDPAALARAAPAAKQVELRWLAGRALLVASASDGDTEILDAKTLLPVRVPERMILSAAATLVPSAPIVRVERLRVPDLYYYNVGVKPTLPVLRVEFGDPAKTWVHIDPATGAILGDLDARRRLYRLLFDLLHKWDLNALTLNRPAWDILLWLPSVAGLITSISGIRIGWARLMRPSRRTPRRSR